MADHAHCSIDRISNVNIFTFDHKFKFNFRRELRLCQVTAAPNSWSQFSNLFRKPTQFAQANNRLLSERWTFLHFTIDRTLK